jgi:hypothetical protein
MEGQNIDNFNNYNITDHTKKHKKYINSKKNIKKQNINLPLNKLKTLNY